MRRFLYLFLFISSLHANPLTSEKTLENQLVDQTDAFYILVDYAPITRGHLLVVAKREDVKVLTDLTEDEFLELYGISQKIASVFDTLLKTNEYILLEKNGKKAGQSIDHLHFHYIPIESDSSRFFGQLRVLYRIIFGSSAMNNEELANEKKRFKDAFSM